MSKTLEQIEKELDAPIPRSAVSERDGGGGRKLSYLEGHYVIDRLNKVFGPLNWDKEIVDVREVINKTAKGELPAYLVKVKLTLTNICSTGLVAKVVIKEAYGYGSAKSERDGHELAMKEAVTDALKVAAKDLGMSMGLALYDKSQENVVDDETGSKEDKGKLSKEVKQNKSGPPTSTGVSTDAGTDKDLKEAIRTYVRIAEATKKLERGSFKGKLMKEYGADHLDKLNKQQLETLLNELRELTK